MTQSKFFKAFAIINALTFVILFLLYRNGTFDSYFSASTNTTLTSPNGGTPTKTPETPPKTLTSPAEMERLSSSKTFIMTDHIKIKKDTTKIHYKPVKLDSKNLSITSKTTNSSNLKIEKDSPMSHLDCVNVQIKIKENPLLYSSKSGIIFPPKGKPYKPKNINFKKEK